MLDDESIRQLQERLRVYRRNLNHSLAQVAQHGGETAAPLAIANAIHDARDQISEIKAQLRASSIQIEDHPDDTRPSPRGSSSELQVLPNSQPIDASVAHDSALDIATFSTDSPTNNDTLRRNVQTDVFPRNKQSVNFSGIPKSLRSGCLVILNLIVAGCVAGSFSAAMITITDFAKISASASANANASPELISTLVTLAFLFFIMIATPIFCLWILIVMYTSPLRKQHEQFKKQLNRLYEMPEILEYIADYDRQLFSTVWENWLDFLRYLKKRSRRAEDILRHCVPLEVQGDTLKVGCPGNVILRQISGQADNSPKSFIEKALFEFYGKPNKIAGILKDDEDIVQIKAKMYDPSKENNDSLEEGK